MATLKGARHGGESERIAALLSETETPQRARAVVVNRLRRGERIPGFGHPLYPDGDPRAALLLHLAEASGNHDAWRLVRGLLRAASDLLNEQPNMDFGLVALAQCYG